MSALLKTMAARLSFASRLGANPLVMVAPAARPASPRAMATRAQITKKELVSEVMKRASLTNTQAEAAVRAVVDTIVVNVALGERYGVPVPHRWRAEVCNLPIQRVISLGNSLPFLTLFVGN